MPADLDLVRRLSAAEHGLAVVGHHAARRDRSCLVGQRRGPRRPGHRATVRRPRRRGGARKLSHLRRAGRAAVVFRSGWEWVSVEGPVPLAGPAIRADGLAPDARAMLLRDIFTAVGGTHDDWDDLRPGDGRGGSHRRARGTRTHHRQRLSRRTDAVRLVGIGRIP